MTTLLRVSNASNAGDHQFCTIHIGGIAEADAFVEKFDLFLQNSNQMVTGGDLLITFPTTARSIPFPVIERVLAHYKPTTLTLACNTIHSSIRIVSFDRTPSGLSVTTKSSSQKMTNSCTEQFDLPPTLSETKELWLSGEWVRLIALTEALQKAARPIIQYVSNEAEWRPTMIVIDLDKLRA